MMFCSDFEPGTSHSPTIGPIDASHGSWAMVLPAFLWVYEGLYHVHTMTSLCLVSCPLVKVLIGVVFWSSWWCYG